MKRKHLIIFFISIALAGGAFTQTPQQTFKAATEAFENGNYAEAISKAKNCITQLGSSNPRVQSLLVQCYYEQKDWLNAKIELNRYKKMATNATSEAHRNLLSLETEIDKQIEILENNHKKEVDKKRLAEAEKIITTNQDKNAQKQTQIENDYNTAVGKISDNITQEQIKELLEQGDSTGYYAILKANKKKYPLKSVSYYNINNKGQVGSQGVQYYDEKGRIIKSINKGYYGKKIALQDTLSTSTLESIADAKVSKYKYEDLGNNRTFILIDSDKDNYKIYEQRDIRGNVVKDSTIHFYKGNWNSTILKNQKYDAQNRITEYIGIYMNPEGSRTDRIIYTYLENNVLKVETIINSKSESVNIYINDGMGNHIKSTTNEKTLNEYQYDHRGNQIIRILNKSDSIYGATTFFTNEYWDGTIAKSTFSNATQEKETSVAKTEIKEEILTNTTTASTNTETSDYKTLFEKVKTTTATPEEAKTFFGNYLVTTQFFTDQKEFNLKKSETVQETNTSYSAGMMQYTGTATNSNFETLQLMGMYVSNNVMMQKDVEAMLHFKKNVFANVPTITVEEIKSPLFDPATTRILKMSVNGTFSYTILYADKGCNYTLDILVCPKSLENTILNEALANRLKQLTELNK